MKEDKEESSSTVEPWSEWLQKSVYIVKLHIRKWIRKTYNMGSIITVNVLINSIINIKEPVQRVRSKTGAKQALELTLDVV